MHSLSKHFRIEEKAVALAGTLCRLRVELVVLAWSGWWSVEKVETRQLCRSLMSDFNIASWFSMGNVSEHQTHPLSNIKYKSHILKENYSDFGIASAWLWKSWWKSWWKSLVFVHVENLGQDFWEVNWAVVGHLRPKFFSKYFGECAEENSPLANIKLWTYL